jgi:hypothetical protein
MSLYRKNPIYKLRLLLDYKKVASGFSWLLKGARGRQAPARRSHEPGEELCRIHVPAGGARKSQKEPRNKEKTGGARGSQEDPQGASRIQEEPGGARRSQDISLYKFVSSLGSLFMASFHSPTLFWRHRQLRRCSSVGISNPASTRCSNNMACHCNS